MSQILTVTNDTSLEETSSSNPELNQKSEDLSTNNIELTTLPIYTNQRSHSSPSVTFESLIEDHSDPQSVIENFSDDDNTSNPATIIVNSSSFISEQNDSIESLNTLSTNISNSQRRIDHRRNKSEPVKSLSNEDLHCSTNLESSLSNNAQDECRRKSLIKIKSNLDDKTLLTTTRKKKAWYNPFQSSYRQRNEEFRKIFKDLPSDERLVVDYSCAWQKDILAQGRMYLSANYLCFYANILNWKSCLCLKFEDIVCITREKTAKVISNAIEIKSNKSEKYFFTSFVTRDKTFAILDRLWNAIHLNQPISSQQLWIIIHENYGNNLDMTTDEDDDYRQKTLMNNKFSTISNNQDDRINSQSLSSKIDDDHTSISSQDEQQTDDDLSQKESSMNTTSENFQRSYLRQCPCQSHLSTQLINRTYSMPVDQLFHYIFNENDFLVAFRTARRIKDYRTDQWQINTETGKRERSCSYKVTIAAVFGSTNVCSHERQIIESEQSNSHYIIDTEVRNEGIKYSDAFYIASRYCLIQIGPYKSHLKVTCEVRYVKSLMAIIKTFIEKNALTALQDSYTDLMKRMDHESSKQLKFSENHIQSNNHRISSRHVQVEQLPIDEFTCNSTLIDNHIESDFNQLDENCSTKNTFLVTFCIITTLLLLIVNIFLCIKLNQIDQMTDHLIHHSPSWFHRYSSNDDNQWASLLKNQEEYYEKKLNNLQTILTTTHNVLKNVTDALNQLSQRSS